MTSASVWGWHDRRPLRMAIAAAATFDALWLGWMTRYDVPNDWQHADPGPIFGGLAHAPVLHALVVAATVVALWIFALGKRPVLQGSIALGLLFLVYETNAFQTGFIMPEMHVAATALLGWVVGSALAAALDPLPQDDQATSGQLAQWRWVARDRLAESLAVTGLVANYAMSAFSKWMAAGWQWDGRIIRRLLFAFRHVDDTSWMAQLADWLRLHPWLPEVLALGTLLIQSGAPLLLAGPRWRMGLGLALVAMHITMTLTTGVFDPQLVVIVGALCLPWPQWMGRTQQGPKGLRIDPDRVRPIVTKACVTAAVLATAAWVLPIRKHMTVRFNVSQTPWDRSQISRPDQAQGKDGGEVLPPAGPDVLAWLAPLRPGAALGSGKIARISAVAHGGVQVVVATATGEVVLQLHKIDAAAPHPPAVHGEVAIYYQGAAKDGAALAEALAAALQDRALPAGLGRLP